MYNAVNLNLHSRGVRTPRSAASGSPRWSARATSRMTRSRSRPRGRRPAACPPAGASTWPTPGPMMALRQQRQHPLVPGTQAFTSYAGNAGTFTFGFSNLMHPQVVNAHNGAIYNDSKVTIAAITDGTSNTFMFGEHSKGTLLQADPAYAVSDGSWNSGRWYDTLFSTMYPLNLAHGNNPAAAAQRLPVLHAHGRGQPAPRRRQLRLLRRLRATSSRTRSTRGPSPAPARIAMAISSPTGWPSRRRQSRRPTPRPAATWSTPARCSASTSSSRPGPAAR